MNLQLAQKAQIEKKLNEGQTNKAARQSQTEAFQSKKKTLEDTINKAQKDLLELTKENERTGQRLLTNGSYMSDERMAQLERKLQELSDLTKNLGNNNR